MDFGLKVNLLSSSIAILSLKIIKSDVEGFILWFFHVLD